MTRYLAPFAAAGLLLQGCAAGADFSNLLSTKSSATVSPELGASQQSALYLGVVDGLIRQGRHSAALAFLDGYRQRGETLVPRYWLLRGNALLSLSRNEEAGDAFSKLTETPHAAQGWNGLGRIAAAEHNWTVAALEFQEAVDREPANADFLNNLGFADLNLGRARQAAAIFEQAHELEPGSERIRTNLVVALTMNGDGSRADIVLAGIADAAKRASTRALVKTAIATLTRETRS
jgi:tetratricopeptide (TPR) repeat protein